MQVNQRAGEPVHRGDDQLIARAQIGQRAVEAGPLRGRAADLIGLGAKNLLLFETGHRPVQILILGADASVADLLAGDNPGLFGQV
ncbi:hypothetical protein J2S39_000020 [Corynebacterium guangdongense]|uniref:Uncharacterized protein n=1 Tax=Corynebacterium guangdongense TaxID=1783348 RepID=A0ABU1ZTU4_9CORY|nr:hypothetical protein [Corynebacterium guangdongense]